jgi:ribosomal protein L37AE/L43A
MLENADLKRKLAGSGQDTSSGEKVRKCPKCGSLHVSERDGCYWGCDDCGETFRTDGYSPLDDFKNAIEGPDATSDKWTCNACGEKCSSYDEWLRHEIDVHGERNGE